MSRHDFIGPPCPFRAVGFAWQAGNYPLSQDAQRIVAEHNGIPVERMPRGFRNAPNTFMLAWLERLGGRLSAGLPTRHGSGRWLLMKEL